MSYSDLKSRIHKKIDQVNDIDLLQLIFEKISEDDEIDSGRSIWKDLSAEQQEQIILSYNESFDESKLIPGSKVLKHL